MAAEPSEPNGEASTAPASGKRGARKWFAGLSGNLQGALLMVASGVGFTVYLVLAKQMSATVHPVFLAFWRAAIGLLFTAPLILRVGPSIFRTAQLPLIFLRSLFGTFGFILSLIAVSDFFSLPLAQFNALSFSRPLFVTILAALLLGEIVGPRRWGAVMAGFFGVLVMAVPGVVLFWLPQGEGAISFDLGAALAIASAFAFAGAIVLVKQLSGDHTPAQLLIWANLLSTLLLLGPALWYWSDPGLAGWGLILAMSIAGLGAQFCYITAMSRGDASFLAPMDYLRLPMSALADWLLFRLLPGVYVWVGAAIIVGSTLYIAWREARMRGPRRDD